MLAQIKSKIEQLVGTTNSKIEMSDELYGWLISNNYSQEEIEEIQQFIDGDIIDLMLDEVLFSKIRGELDLKANLDYVNQELAKKLNVGDVEEIDISGKADLSYVNSQLLLKANLDYVNQELAKKLNVGDVEEIDISGKADLSYVDNQLLLKADKLNTYTKSETDLLLNSKQNNVTLQQKYNMVSEINNVYNNI